MSSEIQKIENKEVSPGGSPARLIEMAISSNADIEKLEKLMQMQERWDAKQAEKAFNDAMSRFQAGCPVIEAHKQGHNYKYAPIGDIIAQVQNLLSENGLSYRFRQEQDQAAITVTCVATHRDGHCVELSMTGSPDTSGSKNGVQSIASTVTYLRRYTFTGVFGIVTADTDSDARVQASQKYEPITESQRLELIDLLDRCGVPESKFLLVARVDAIENLARQRFEGSKKWIENVASQQQE